MNTVVGDHGLWVLVGGMPLPEVLVLSGAEMTWVELQPLMTPSAQRTSAGTWPTFACVSYGSPWHTVAVASCIFRRREWQARGLQGCLDDDLAENAGPLAPHRFELRVDGTLIIARRPSEAMTTPRPRLRLPEADARDGRLRVNERPRTTGGGTDACLRRQY
jgi:hypothetical protein